VAVNPFKEVPLYGNRNIEAYRKRSNESPHVYAIADTAIREMIRDEVNQSIIIRLVKVSSLNMLTVTT
jgi:myosin-5